MNERKKEPETIYWRPLWGKKLWMSLSGGVKNLDSIERGSNQKPWRRERGKQKQWIKKQRRGANNHGWERGYQKSCLRVRRKQE